MTLIKHIIPAVLLGALISIGLVIAMGSAVQNSYAADENDGTGSAYKVTLKGVADVAPGDTMDLKASVIKDGQEINPAAEDLHIEWSLGVLGEEQVDMFVAPDPDSNNPDKHVRVGDDSTQAKILFCDQEQIGEAVSGVAFGVTASLMDAEGNAIKDADNRPVTSDSLQFQLSSEFYDIGYEYEEGASDPELFAGETQNVTVNVTQHKSGQEPAPATVKYVWTVDNDGVQVLRDGSKVKTEETGQNVTFTFRRISTTADTEAHLMIYDTNGTEIEDIYFNFYACTNNLADCEIEFDGTDGILFFVDQADLPIQRDSTKCHISVVSGNGDRQVIPESEYDLKIRKVRGYNETTWADVLEDSGFPLNVDPAGSMNINGDRTDGTAQYVIQAVAKSGSRYKGKTGSDTGRLWLIDRRTIVFPAADAGFSSKYINVEQGRYEAEIGKKLTPFVKSYAINKNLTLNKDYSVRYVNNKTSKVTKSFPAKAGTYTVVFSGIKPYYGQIDYVQLLVGKKNTMTAKGKTITCKTRLKKNKTKKSKTFKASKAITVKKAKGTVTYSKVKGNKRIKVAESGKITVKKGIKKGTYKVKVKVTAQGTGTYLAGSKTVTIKVRVKSQ
ncbi:MAG: hypothetical protein IJ109_06210 [Firmicutes bacterium]|nr:hypothetical protein [Bacillota bacterium]